MKFLAFIMLFTVSIYSISCNNQDTATKNNNQTKTATKDSQSDDKIVFKINGNPYYQSDIKGKNLTSALNDAVLYEAAILEGKDKDPKYVELVKKYKTNVLVGRYRGEIIQNYIQDNKPTEEDSKKYYEDNISQFTSLDLTKISTPEKETADKIYMELQNGNTQEQIKSSHEKVNITKIVNVNNYNKNFDKLAVGEFSKPVAERNFHNIYIIDDLSIREYKVAKKSIGYQLINQTKQNAVLQHIDNLKKDKKITIELLKDK